MALLETFLFLLVSQGFMGSLASYMPPDYQGEPIAMMVASEDGLDFRGQLSYRINFTLVNEAGTEVTGFIHRSFEDFDLFHTGLHTHLLDFSIPRPQENSLSALAGYLEEVRSHPNIMTSTYLSDFLGVNWDGRDLGFMRDLPEFMKVVIPQLYRAPAFAPEPPVFTSETDCILAPESQFEIYLYLMAFRARNHLQEYLAYMESFLNTYPDFEGDDLELQPAGVTVDIPRHFNTTFVHFLPGGYLNGHTVRLSFLGKSKFNFLNEDLLEEWLVKLHGDREPPKRILDIGTGPGFSAFVLNKLYPDAEIVAVDLAAPYIRLARQWQAMRNVSNIEFYHANAENMDWLESDSFDFINYAYVLHEMPGENAQRIISEMYRLLRPGGIMNGFEVPYFENDLEKAVSVAFNTWGHNDWEVDGPKGPEPYMYEYEYNTELVPSLEAAGFQMLDIVDYSYFENVFIAQK